MTNKIPNKVLEKIKKDYLNTLEFWKESETGKKACIK